MENLESPDTGFYNLTAGEFIASLLQVQLLLQTQRELTTASPDSLSTLAHERIHFLQALFTGNGQMAWRAHRDYNEALSHYWLVSGRDIDGKLTIPWSLHDGMSEIQRRQAKLQFKVCSDLLRIELYRQVKSAIPIQMKGPEVALVLNPFLRNPTIEFEGNSYDFPGICVFEGHAMFGEESYLQASMVDATDFWNRNLHPTEYWLAYEWYLTKCGHERRHLFPVICELALQGSWDFRDDYLYEKEWQESSPAWRFVRLTEVLASSPDLKMGTYECWPVEYVTFTKKLLHKCGYKDLDTVIVERATATTIRGKLTPMEELMVRGLRYKAAKPWCAANPAIDQILWKSLEEDFPLPSVIVEGDFWPSNPPRGNITTECVNEMHFQALIRQLRGSLSPEARKDSLVECGFRTFKVWDYCPHQRDGTCKGCFDPVVGPPVPFTVKPDGTTTGCTYEEMLLTLELKCSDLKVDSKASMPGVPDEFYNPQPVAKISFARRFFRALSVGVRVGVHAFRSNGNKKKLQDSND